MAGAAASASVLASASACTPASALDSLLPLSGSDESDGHAESLERLVAESRLGAASGSPDAEPCELPRALQATAVMPLASAIASAVRARVARLLRGVERRWRPSRLRGAPCGSCLVAAGGLGHGDDGEATSGVKETPR
jgi:hypothetical protein